MTTHICEFTPSDGEPESARALLWRHGLPEDIVDGALALFAQELAGKIRAHRDHTRGAVQATKVMDFAADLISPENWARTEPVPAGRDALRDRIAEAPGDAARLAKVVRWVTSEVVSAKTEFGDGYRAAQRDIRDLVKGRFDDDAANELRRLADEAQQQTEPACPDPIECGHEAALGQAQQEVKRVREVCDHLRRVSVLADGEPHTDRERGVIHAVTRVLAALDAQPAVVAAVAGEADDTETPFVTRVLDLFAKADCHGELLWRIVDGQPEFSANVSDVFAWGGADCEEITPDTMPVLEQAFVELKALGAEEFIADLYAARLRKMRPQGAAYPSGTHKAWREVSALYDACGPERELGLGNPKSAPAHRAAASQPGKEG